MTIQTELRMLVAGWSRHSDTLPMFNAAVTAADRIDVLEAALREVDMVYLNPVNDPLTVTKRKILSRRIREALGSL